ncbi:hypothetical protein GA0070607_2304 [Micromonospora coriariae]|uniref:Uncharacterized protein n=1 Tax=Micromonospora coriariae TaxID=285665 RepID=A0A1C4VLB7_9ACTN|nr:hypothetical protein GA0070607_2304 [Micromonospora coriariae]
MGSQSEGAARMAMAAPLENPLAGMFEPGLTESGAG